MSQSCKLLGEQSCPYPEVSRTRLIKIFCFLEYINHGVHFCELNQTGETE